MSHYNSIHASVDSYASIHPANAVGLPMQKAAFPQPSSSPSEGLSPSSSSVDLIKAADVPSVQDSQLTL
ncbi:hypothetical protein GGI03_007691, partial [Coemansia sp. RSA 2337]